MMIAVATGFGLQDKIHEKLSGFNGHIQITNFDNNQSEETLAPISQEQDFYPEFNGVEGIKNVHKYATKSGIIRTETDFEGIIFKGIAADFDWTFFNAYLVEGSIPDLTGDVTTEVLISRELSNNLRINLGDQFNMLFVKEDPSKAPWLRVVKAVGIYDSGFSEFDRNFVIGDLRHVQKMNRWSDDQIGGFEVLLEDFDEIEEKSVEVYHATPSTLDARSIVEKYYEIFEWIKVFLNNTYLIIAIIILVAGINMITALLVLILERTQMIGMLKAMGGTNLSVRKVFLYNAGYLILKGLIWGNLIGIAILLIQKYFGLIALNPETYYVSTVPISFDLGHIILLNLGTLLLCLLMLILPTLIITRIRPVKSIKFE